MVGEHTVRLPMMIAAGPSIWSRIRGSGTAVETRIPFWDTCSGEAGRLKQKALLVLGGPVDHDRLSIHLDQVHPQ
jgi:hypothetical protein